MKLHQLAALVTAVETGSLRRAAEKMRLSQPALSRSVRELEREIGVKLIERTPHGVEATVYGKALIMRSKIVESELRQARDDIAHLLAATHGDLRIGASPVAAFNLLPIALARFKKRRPNLRVEVMEGLFPGLLAELRQGDFDFVVGRISEAMDPEDLATEVLFQDDLVIVTRLNHPLTRARRVTKGDLEGCEWILPQPGSPPRTAFEQTFHARVGKMPHCTIESNSFMTMLTVLSRTEFVGIAPRQLFQGTWLQQSFTVLDVGFTFPSQPIGVIRRARSVPSVAAQFAIKELRQAAQQMLVDTDAERV
ncbi:MAG: hypothetical protein JWN71_4454 [Xanthobacteraceae bacterium]|jgi:DNA-binding transcriptional LysR family regulator|nr:hypothetical protein [Xanthobacteraceae bacterium]